MKACVLSIAAAVSLSACGGGATGNTSVEALWRAPAPATVGVVRAKTNGQNGVALVPNVNDAGSYQSVEVVQVISETQNPDGSVSGEVVVRWPDGRTTNVIGVVYGNAALYANIGGNTVSVVAAGAQATNIPVGNYQYSGYAGTEYEYGGLIYSEEGGFVMDVQFGSQTAQLTADTAESRYVNDNLTFNSLGEIAGNDGVFIIYDGDGVTELERRSISFNGTFHGSGATSVSGLAVGVSPSGESAIVGIVGDR